MSKSKIVKLITALLLTFVAGKSQAQVAWDTIQANNVQVCLQPELLRVAFTVGGASSGSYLEVAMPQGFSFHGIVWQRTPAGKSLSVSSVSGNRVRFSFAATPAVGETYSLWVRQMAGCGTVGTTTFRDTATFFNATRFSSNSNAFNSTLPSFSITSISNSPSTTGVGNNVVRQFTITNGGFGASSNVLIEDDWLDNALLGVAGSYTINPSGSNYSIPAARIDATAARLRIRLTRTDIMQVGDGDTLFENGESFVLRYTVQTTSCGNVSNQILSTLSAYWLCNGNTCTQATANTAISISIPAAPVLQRTAFIRSQVCFDGVTPTYDTVRIINTGGAATNMVFSFFNEGGGIGFSPATTGFYDTALIRYKINDNGTPVKPLLYGMSNLNTSFANHTACGSGKVGRFSVTIPLLPGTDTLLFYLPRIYCNSQLVSCVTGNSDGNVVVIGGQSYTLTYQNACGNVSFNAGTTTLYNYQQVGPDVLAADVPANINCGQSRVLLYNLITSNYASPTYSTRSYLEIEPDTGALLNMDPAFPLLQRVYIRAGSTTIFPYRFVNGRYRFALRPIISLGAHSIGIRVKGKTGSICNGSGSAGMSMYLAIDSSLCSSVLKIDCHQFTFNFPGCISCCTDGGIGFAGFEVRRLTLGQVDNNDDGIADGTTRADSNLVRHDRLIAGDTFRMDFVGNVLTTGSNPNWLGAFANANLNAALNVTHIRSRVRIKFAAGGDTTWLVTPTVIADTLYWNLTPRRRLLNGDSIFMWSWFRNDLLNVSRFTQIIPHLYATNSGSASTSYSGSYNGSGRFQCGSQSANLNRLRSSSRGRVFTTATLSGCQQAFWEAAVICETNSINASTNFFPNEFRRLYSLDGLRFRIPTGFTIDSVNGVYARSVGNLGSLYSVTTIRNMAYTVVNDTFILTNLPGYFVPGGGSLPVSDENTRIDFGIYASPSCRAPNNVQQTIDLNIAARYLPTNVNFTVNQTNTNPRTVLLPSYVLNSSQPVALAYSKVISWPLAWNNAGTFSTPNNWLRLVSPNGNIIVDSIRMGTSLITADVNGFFQVGTIAASATTNFTVYARSSACRYDSLLVYIGYGCTGYPTSWTASTCSYPPVKLYVQPQPAEIQTQVTALASTPVNPANPAAGLYGSNTIPDICSEVPVEILLISSQPSTIFDAQEVIQIPVNSGNPSLQFVSGSGYIEYPLGTTPRAFSTAANTALSVSGATQLTMSLNQIDPTNFNTLNGLQGTGTAPNNTFRQVKLRFRMRSNCNFLNGDLWSTIQRANSPCGQAANGNNQRVSGYILAVNGVSNPYTMNTLLNLSKDSLLGLNDSLRATATLQKIGAAAVSATDTIRIIFPANSIVGTINCIGTRCPSSTPAFTVSTVGTNREYKLVLPGTLGNADTLRFVTWVKSSPARSGCSENNTINFRTTQTATLFCSTTGTNCPGAQLILGQESKTYDIEKPNLVISNYSGRFVTGIPQFMYSYAGRLTNTSTQASVASGFPTVLETWFDVNYNGVFEPAVDRLVRTKTYTNAISRNGGILNFTDTFQYTGGLPPDPFRPMFTIVRTTTGSNCMCDTTVVSSLVVSLPVSWGYFNAVRNHQATVDLSWQTLSEDNSASFRVLRMLDNEENYRVIGEVTAGGNSSLPLSYGYQDRTSEIKKHAALYRIQLVNTDGSLETSSERLVLGPGKQVTKEYKVYPNPATTDVQVYGIPQGVSVRYEIWNINGQKMNSGIMNVDGAKLDISSLEAGVYTLRLMDERGVTNVKLIKF